MNFIKTLLIFIISINLYAQIDGDNIFAEDQIITVDLVFEDSDFWELLQANYQTGNYLEADLTITDNTGRMVLTDTFKSTEQTVNLSVFDNGVYFIRTDKESQPVKIIKQ